MKCQNERSPLEVHVVGAGLAGSECALQLASLLGPRGFKIVLHEMRGAGQSTPAHRTADCAELVCSNSFGSIAGHSAAGLLKWEAEHLGSYILGTALETRVPAGQALGMDRELFARHITEIIIANPFIEVRRGLIDSLEHVPRPAVIATGPLTHDRLALSIQDHFSKSNSNQSEFLYFFDAIAPIIAADSINSEIAWKADRWDRGTKDYWNCPMSKTQYFEFIEAIRTARKIESKEFEKVGVDGQPFEDTPYFESCMPIEAILERGPQTLRFGPMSGKGLTDPATGKSPYAAVQLRQDNREATAFNMVGFQTKMAYGEQSKIFRMIPGLEEAEFLKLGSIHRNLYLNTPKLLNRDLSSKTDPWLFFAGQITGVEGYFESACIGLLVARFLAAKLDKQYALDAGDLSGAVDLDGEDLLPPRETAFGSLHAAITDATKIDFFQPTNINFSHLPEPSDYVGLPPHARIDKTAKKSEQIVRAKHAFQSWRSSFLSVPREMITSQVEAAAEQLLR